MLVFGETTWDPHERAQFRLAGFGGAAVFLRTSVLNGAAVGGQAPVIAMDIGFLSPNSSRHVLSRPVDPDLPARLSRFLLSAADEFHPELSVAPCQDELAGLVVTVESSAADRVCLRWTVVEDLDEAIREFDGLTFETSRVALVAASHEARLLDQAAPRFAHWIEGR